MSDTDKALDRNPPPTGHDVRWMVVGAFADSLINFRGPLIEALAREYPAGTAASETASDLVLGRLHSIEVRHREYPVSRNGMNPREDLGTLAGLFRLFKQDRPTHVLAYTVKPVVWSGIALMAHRQVRFTALITGLGYVFEGHSPKKRMVRWLVSQLYRLALKRADAVVFQNCDNRDEFLQRGLVTADKCHVVNGSGVPVNHYSFAPLPSERPLVFLLIARLLSQKGIREFVAAARKVKSRGWTARFLLAGPPDPSPDRIDLAEVESWASEGIIEYLGSLADVRPAISDCHVYVLPSYYPEGVPRTALEAMSMGRPILTTDAPGCRETVNPGENGWLVPKADPESLAARMGWFIENADQLTRMGQASRHMAESRFDVRKVNADMIRIMGLS